MTHNANRERNNPGTTPEVQRSEQQAQRTFEEARNTASQVASDVQNTAQRAISNATQKFDFKEQIGQRPLLMLGGALAVGYWLGKMNTGGRQEYGQYQGQEYGRNRGWMSAFMPSSSGQSSYSQQPYSQQPYGQQPHEQQMHTAAMKQAAEYASSQRVGMVGKLGRKLFANLSSLEELYHEELQDIYDAEHQILKALPKMVEAASAPELKRAFDLHLQQTQGQIRRLEQIFGQIGMKPQGKPCVAMEGLITEGAELIAMRADPEVKDAGLIAAAQRIEHYEIAGYGCLRTWARQLGHHQVAQLFQQTLDEEEQTDRQLTQIAERGINTRAAQT